MSVVGCQWACTDYWRSPGIVSDVKAPLSVPSDHRQLKGEEQLPVVSGPAQIIGDRPMSKLRLSIPSDNRQLTLTTALLPPVENLGQAATDPPGVDGGNS